MKRQGLLKRENIDRGMDERLTRMYRERHQDHPLSVEKYISSLELTPTNALIALCEEGMRLGISERFLCDIHKMIFVGPPEFGGVYRPIVMMGGDYRFVDHWTIPNEMEKLLAPPMNTVGSILFFMVEALGRIHPFIDMNRRTIFLTSAIQMAHIRCSPINWGEQRLVWEQSREVSGGLDAKKRLHILMESLLSDIVI